jgi:hypothetical protein
VPGENPNSGKQYKFCRECRSNLLVPKNRARLVSTKTEDEAAEVGFRYRKKGGKGVWKSGKRYRIFNHDSERWHTEHAIVVWHEEAIGEIAEQCPDGREIPNDWCKDADGTVCKGVDGSVCLRLTWSNKDFQPAVLKPSSTKRARGGGEDREDEDEDEDDVGEDEGEGGEGRRDEDEGEGEGEGEGRYSSRETTDRQTQIRLNKIQEMQERINGSVRILQTQIAELQQATTSGEQGPLVTFYVNELQRKAQDFVSCKENYEQARHAVRTGGDAHAAQSSAYRSLSAGAEASELQFTSCGGSSSVTEGQGSSVPPEGVKLLESLEALAVADTPPQLQQLHEEYKALYRAVIDAA